MKSRTFALLAFVVCSLAGRALAQTFYWENPADSTLIVNQVLSISTVSSTLTRATVRSTAGGYATMEFSTTDAYPWIWNRPAPLSAEGSSVIVAGVRGFQTNRSSFRPMTCLHLFRASSGSTTYRVSPRSEIQIDVASPQEAPVRYVAGVDFGVLTRMYLWDHTDLWTSVTILEDDGDLKNLHLVRSPNATTRTLNPMTATQAMEFNRGILVPPNWVYVSNTFAPDNGYRYLHQNSHWTNR